MTFRDLDGPESDTEVPSIVYRRLLVWFVRILALALIAEGLRTWAVILGVMVPGGVPFTEMSLTVRAATVAFAVAHLVAAVGLWLTAAWGAVVWLVSAAAFIGLHTGLAATFGAQTLEVAIIAAAAVVHITLMLLAWWQDRAQR